MGLRSAIGRASYDSGRTESNRASVRSRLRRCQEDRASRSTWMAVAMPQDISARKVLDCVGFHPGGRRRECRAGPRKRSIHEESKKSRSVIALGPQRPGKDKRLAATNREDEMENENGSVVNIAGTKRPRPGARKTAAGGRARKSGP